jgi:hypothetical protein
MGINEYKTKADLDVSGHTSARAQEGGGLSFDLSSVNTLLV